MSADLDKMLRDAFRARNIGDYMFDEDVTETEAKTILANARSFLDLAENILARG